MRAAATTRSLKVYPEEDREALDRIRALTDALHEELVVWDVATLRGRRAARRRGVRKTPAIVFGSEGVESIDGFAEKAASSLRAKGVASS